MLEKVLKRSDALDREALCIVAGQRVSELRQNPFPPDLLLTLVAT